MITKSEKDKIIEKLAGKLSETDFLRLKSVILPKLKFNFELIEDDVWENHINAGKPVSLIKHPLYSDFLNPDAKTKGTLIEGDNLLGLFLLQDKYKNKVDLIYIDPPYNNGKKGFIYNNDYSIKGDDKGLCLVKDRNSLRHTRWLTIMYNRLKYAKKLLKDTGLIVISIDDNEIYNLKPLMDEVFGRDCYKGTIIWNKGAGMWSRKNIRKDHEYILVYEKLKGQSQFYFQPEKEEIWVKRKLLKGGHKGKWDPSGSLWYSIIYQGEEIWPCDSLGNNKLWALSKEKFEIEKTKGNVWFEKDKTGKWVPWRKYIKTGWGSYLKSIESFGSMGAIDLKKDLNKTDIFDYPKPISIMKHLILHMAPKNGLILDYYAGAGTTACAVAQLNKEDSGKRQFILVTNNEGDNIKFIKTREQGVRVFRDVLYPRLSKNQDKYSLSCEVFMIDTKII